MFPILYDVGHSIWIVNLPVLGPIKPLTCPCVNRFICGLQKEMSSLRCLRHARRLMWWAHPLSQGRGFQKDWVDDNMVTRTPKWGAYSRLHDIALWPTIVLSYLSTDTLNIFESLDSRLSELFHQVSLPPTESKLGFKKATVSGKSFNIFYDRQRGYHAFPEVQKL